MLVLIPSKTAAIVDVVVVAIMQFAAIFGVLLLRGECCCNILIRHCQVKGPLAALYSE